MYNLDGTLRGYFGQPGRQAGQLRYPDGTVCAAEHGNNRVQLFSPEGESLAVYGSAGRELGQLAYPWALVTDAKRRAFILDSGSNRVQVWQF
ncbi:MAG: hypothetical protein ACLFVU_03145 [Phycisphaerae bacterium]